jgi:uncharacterized iron-regulated membrane protein
MKNTFRQSMAWLHTWVGLAVGWVLYFIFLTGTLGYFDTEIDRWMRPERPLTVADWPSEQRVAVALRRLQHVAPDAEQWLISPGGDREQPDLRIFYRQRPVAGGARTAAVNELLDPATGLPQQYRETGGGQVLYQMHYELQYLPAAVAYWIVGVCAMFMLVALITGVIVHRKIFKDFFTFRPGKQQRSWLDAHNVLSVVALPFHLMITYSGLIFFAATYMPLVISATYGAGDKNRQVFAAELLVRDTNVEAAGVAAPLAALAPILAQVADRWGPNELRTLDIRHPGDANARITLVRATSTPLRSAERLVFDGVTDRLLEVQAPTTSGPRTVRDVLLGLHEGLFATSWLRWLYFLSGLIGTAMIGTGLVLWTVKRQQQARGGFGLALVQRLNLGTILGLPIGIAAYFWANRLLPVDVVARARWEVNAMFIAWALMLLHAHGRVPSKAWPEQAWIAAGAFGLLPVLNAFTTERHLGVTLFHGEWVLAGMDLTLLAAGIAFAITAFKLQRRASIEYRTSPVRESLSTVAESR